MLKTGFRNSHCAAKNDLFQSRGAKISVLGLDGLWFSPFLETLNITSQTKLQTSGSNSVTEPVPIWKRFLDVTCILLFSPFLLPLGFFLAAFIKLISPGPAIFKQERVGYLGRRFVIFKFRTMVVAAEAGIHKNHLDNLMSSDAPLVKLDASGDPRLIRGGKVLRALGLDELPQVLNVLRGEMSLVGPRPCVEYEFQRFSAWQRRRFSTLPGLTGLWQVSGKNQTTFSQMIEFDIQYSESKSFWFDLKILFKTIPAILSQLRESSRGKKSLSPLRAQENTPFPNAEMKERSGRT